MHHDRDPVADHLQLAEQVRVQKHCPPLVFKTDKNLADVLAPDRVHAVGRLIEHHQLRVVHQRLGQAHPLAHAFGVAADFVCRPIAHPYDLEQFLGLAIAGVPIDACHRAEVTQQLSTGEVFGEVVVFRQVADLSEHALLTDPGAEQRSLAFGGLDDREQDLDERGLARTVGAKEPEDLAAADPQVHPTQGVDLASIHLFDATDIDHRFHRPASG